MQSNQLKRIHPNTKRMIVARGGKRGKTSGRGGKGQSARAGNKRRPEWRDIIKQMPKLRGRGVNQNKSIQQKPAIVNVGLLEEVFSAGDKVSPTVLVEKFAINMVSGNIPMVKILGDGEITKKLIVTGCFVSEGAKAKIEKAGGSVADASKAPKVKNSGPKNHPVNVISAPVKEKAAPKKEKAPVKEKKVKETKEEVVKGDKKSK